MTDEVPSARALSVRKAVLTALYPQPEGVCGTERTQMAAEQAVNLYGHVQDAERDASKAPFAEPTRIRQLSRATLSLRVPPLPPSCLVSPLTTRYLAPHHLSSMLSKVAISSNSCSWKRFTPGPGHPHHKGDAPQTLTYPARSRND